MRALRTLLCFIPTLVAVTSSCTYDEAAAPARIGSLTIRTHTTGSQVDEDGYQVRLDEGAPFPIDFTASLTVPALIAGDHQLLLDGVATNCRVLGENPRAFPILQNMTSNIVLEVACSASGGFLEISTVTGGVSPDPDGYEVAVSASPSVPVTDAAQLRVFVAAGSYEIALSGIASNCHVEGENPRQVAVVPPLLAKTAFQIVCLPPPRTKIAFAGDLAFGVRNLWTMNADGSFLQNLTPDMSGAQSLPSWSPDGTQILFMNDRRDLGGLLRGHNIVVMSSIGSDPITLAPGELNATPWSPDGQRIVFTRITSPLGEPADPQIWVMNRDGTGARALTNLPSSDPVWSPDGSRIAFIRDDRIFLMNPDGSNQLPLTSPGSSARDRGARWSPDGSQIAFMRVEARFDEDFYTVGNLWIANTNGSNPRGVTNFGFDGIPGDLRGYSWAPDGARLTFSNFLDIYSIGADGTAEVNLTNSPNEFEQEPAWSPDGSSILFTTFEDLFVMDASGGNIRNLTNQAEPDRASEAVWQP